MSTKEGAIAGVRLEQASATDGRALARVHVALAKPSEFVVRSARNTIRVELKGAASPSMPVLVPTKAAMPRTEAAADAGRGFDDAAGRAAAHQQRLRPRTSRASRRASSPARRRRRSLERIKSSKTPGATTVTLVGNGRLAPRGVTESKDRPRRLVIDLPNVTSTAPAQTAIDSPLVTRVRVAVNSHQPLVTRVVMEIARLDELPRRAKWRERPRPGGRVRAGEPREHGPSDAGRSLGQHQSSRSQRSRPRGDGQRRRDHQAGSRGRAGRSDAGAEVGGGGTSNVVESSAGTQQRRDNAGADVAPPPPPPPPPPTRPAVPASPSTPAGAQPQLQATAAPTAAAPPTAPPSQPAGAGAAGPDPGRARASTRADTCAAGPDRPGLDRGDQPRQYTGDPLSLDLDGVDLRAVLRTLADVSGLNMVIDPDVQGTVDIKLTDVPWDQALDVILRGNQLDYSVDGTIVRISKIKTLEDENKARQAAAQAAAERQAQAGGLSFETFPLSYAKAAEIAPLLEGLAAAVEIRAGAGRCPHQHAHHRRPAGAVPGDPAAPDHARSRRAAGRNRSPDHSDDSRLRQAIGVQWGLNGRMTPDIGNTTNLAFPNQGTIGGRLGGTQEPTDPRATELEQTSSGVRLGVPDATSAIGLALGAVNGAFNLDVALSALERTGKGRVLSTPRVTTQNNVEAEIMQGVQIPIHAGRQRDRSPSPSRTPR